MKKIDRALSAYQNNAFIKTSYKQDRQNKEDKEVEEKESGYKKAAKFLLLVGPNQAAEVLKQFSAEDVERIVKEIVSVRDVTQDESGEILEEFGKLGGGKPGGFSMPKADETVFGGPEKAREMLLSAFGDTKGSEIFKKVLPFGGRKPFDFLNELETEQILLVLKNEPPYVLSIVFSFLKPELSSKILKDFPEESRKEVVLRMARQGEVAPGVIEKMEAVFRDRIRAQGQLVTEEIDGKSVLAGILKYMDYHSEEKILEELEHDDRELAGIIKESIYTIDLILKMDDKDIQYVLRDFENSELAVIIKGKNDKVRSKLLDNLSERRRVMIEEESIYLGEMRRSDVDKSTKELIQYMMDLEKKDLIKIPRGDEKWI